MVDIAEIDGLSAVVRDHLLPDIVREAGWADQFSDWKFEGFREAHPGTLVSTGQLVGRVSAVYWPSGKLVGRTILVPSPSPSYQVSQMMDDVDRVIQSAVMDIVRSVAHTDGVACRNQFCEKCYA